MRVYNKDFGFPECKTISNKINASAKKQNRAHRVIAARLHCHSVYRDFGCARLTIAT